MNFFLDGFDLLVFLEHLLLQSNNLVLQFSLLLDLILVDLFELVFLGIDLLQVTDVLLSYFVHLFFQSCQFVLEVIVFGLHLIAFLAFSIFILQYLKGVKVGLVGFFVVVGLEFY